MSIEKINASKKALEFVKDGMVVGLGSGTTAKEFINLMNSCEKNADSIGLEKGRLFVHVSAQRGQNFRRRR